MNKNIFTFLLLLVILVYSISAPDTTQAVSMSTTLADFETGYPTGWFEFTIGSSSLSTAIITITDSDPLPLPGQSGDNKVLQVDFNIPSGDFGGIGTDFTPVTQDWRDFESFGFWFRGNNTGEEYIVQIFDNSTVDSSNAECFDYIFVDDVNGWRFIVLPFSSFTRSTFFQPQGAPDDGLTLSEMWGWDIFLPSSGQPETVYFDDFHNQLSTMEYATKSGLVWRDYNNNGNRDEIIVGSGVYEPPIPGWYVQLWTYNPSSGLMTFVDRAMTDGNGVYTFDMVTPDEDYIVCEELWDSFWVQTYPSLLTPPPPGEGVQTCPYTGEGGSLLGPVGWTFSATGGDQFLNNNFSNSRDPGCTSEDGYWKTHSIYGPAYYDETWAEIGEDTPFFSSGYSWYEVIKIPPKGNQYFVLAKQYVAAQLNILAGAVLDDITTPINVFGRATDLLENYTPDYDWKTDADGIRDEFINLATTLKGYNEGQIGPGLCD